MLQLNEPKIELQIPKLKENVNQKVGISEMKKKSVSTESRNPHATLMMVNVNENQKGADIRLN